MYGRVLNEEIIQEREAYRMLQDVWKDLARIQPNLLGPCVKVSVPADKEGPATKAAPKAAPVAKVGGKRPTTCSQCGQQGHNKRTCQQ